MRDVIIGIQEDIERGLLTFQQIANKHRVPLDWVDIACGELMENYQDQINDNWYDEQFELNDE
jgi:predicted flap endonuclease-1-like 5' DNA nuclease